MERNRSMLSTAASAGQQLVHENDSLQEKLKESSKRLKDKQDALDTLQKTNELLTLTATRSGAEADELHKKLVKAHKQMEQLREDNALLTSLNEQHSFSSNLPRQPSDDHVTQQDANELIEQLQHEKQAVEKAYHDEQEKCAQFLQNAEINARKASLAESENEDLKAQLKQLEHAYNELNNHMQHEIHKYEESLQELQAEYSSLQQQLHESQQFALKSPPVLHKQPSSVRHINRMYSDSGLGAELEELGYFEQPLSDNVDEETIDSGNQSPHRHFQQATVDAQEEFFRLTVIAAKIKFNDVPINSQTLWEKVKEANVAFHELADWLNDYLMAERMKIQAAEESVRRNTRIQSITNKQSEDSSPSKGASPSKHFFRKIKDLADSVTNFSSTLRLEVRFGRRVFEVKMKKHDTLQTLLQTLPRIIGEDAEAMELFKENVQLDPNLKLVDLGLNHNDVLRMIHRNKVPSFLQRYDQHKQSSTGSVDKNSVEMESEELKQ